MKKLTAILLLAVLLLNLVGYRGWFYLAEQQWNAKQELSLDNELYDEAELITIKVPLRLPYISDTKEFRRTDGEINVNGKIYRYVKSKVEHGAYVLLCLPDQYRQRLEKAKQDYVKFSNDIAQDNASKKPGSSSSALKLLISDYDNCLFNFHSIVFEVGKSRYFTMQDDRLVFYPHLSPAQPPELCRLNQKFSCI